MDALEARSVPLYAVLLGLLALGACFEQVRGSGDTVWASGGASVAAVVVVGLLLIWAAAIPQQTAWPAALLIAGGLVALAVTAASIGDEPYGTGAQLLATTFALTAIAATAQVTAIARAGRASPQ